MNQSSILQIIVDDLKTSSPNKKQRAIIQNGLLVPPVMYMKKELKLIDTCGFDSIFEIVSNMYCNSISIKNLCTRQDIVSIQFMKAIKYYNIHFDLDQLYQDRATILLPLFKEELGIVNCKVNVNRLFEMLIQPYACIIESSTCICGNRKVKSLFSRSISTGNFFSKGLGKLETIINDDLQDKLVYCQKCDKKTAHLVYELGEYLTFDLEYFYESKNADIISTYFKTKVKVITTDLNTIPETLSIKGKIYHLRGIIEFIEPPYTIMHCILL